jgi:UPF0271 protein
MNSNNVIDINCDLGEGITEQDCLQDAQIMPFISRCNIACGGHAGNDLTMRLSLKNAAAHNIKAGIHPGYEDRDNFGRVSLKLPIDVLIHSLSGQIKRLIAIAQEQRVILHHIKLHGALYNDVEQQVELADALSNFLYQHYPLYTVIGLAGGLFEEACITKGLTFIPEGFIDRRYKANGKLTPRSEDGAVIVDQNKSLTQAIALALGTEIKTSDQQLISPVVKTLCLHGDNPNAVVIAHALSNHLKDSGISIL